MTQEEYRELERFREEVRALQVDNGVWRAQAVGFKEEADVLKARVEELKQANGHLYMELTDVNAENDSLRAEMVRAEGKP